MTVLSQLFPIVGDAGVGWNPCERARPRRHTDSSAAMKRALSAHHSTRPKARVQPSAEHAEIALREARLLMAPVALWLLRNGVSYPAFAETLKAVFVDTSRRELERAG